jgi:fused signal recognition particle receptor
MSFLDRFKNKKKDAVGEEADKIVLPDTEEEEAEATPGEVLRNDTGPVNDKLTAAGEESEPSEPPREKTKFGLFERFKAGLSKTRQNISGKIENLVKSYRKLDDDFWEELEDILIQADVGINTSMEMVENIKTAAKKRKINDTAEITGLIQEEIKKSWTLDPCLLTWLRTD